MFRLAMFGPLAVKVNNKPSSVWETVQFVVFSHPSKLLALFQMTSAKIFIHVTERINRMLFFMCGLSIDIAFQASAVFQTDVTLLPIPPL